jgi:hypothetical protein
MVAVKILADRAGARLKRLNLVSLLTKKAPGSLLIRGFCLRETSRHAGRS